MGAIVRAVCGRRTKWLTLMVWLVVVVGLGGLGSRLAEVQKNDISAWLPSGAESTRTLTIVQRLQPDHTVEAQIVYVRAGGLTAGDKAKVDADARAFASVPGVRGTVGAPEVSADGKAIQVRVPVELPKTGWDQVKTTADGLRGIAAADAAGLSVHIAGQAGYTADQAAAYGGIDGVLLAVAALVVIVLLLLTYRSPVLWLLPLAAVSVALMVAQGLIYLLARDAGLTIDAQGSAVLTVIIFGVGTDYALLLIARYREELRRHEDRHVAMAVALRRAGSAVVASAATVAAGMLCLMFAQMRSTEGLGPVVAIGVAVTVLAMLTLLPALLTACGRWVFWPVRPVHGAPEPAGGGFWHRLGTWISARARLVWLLSAAVLAVAALGAVNLRLGGLNNEDTFVDRPDSVVGQRAIEEHYGAGVGDPALIVARAGQADQVRAAAAGVDGVAAASTGPVTGDGWVLVTAVLRDPSDSAAAREAIGRLRTAVHAVPGAQALVGGDTAVRLDIADASRSDNLLIIPLVLLVVFGVLAGLLRSLLAPLLLMATVVLSFGAALGVSALVFDHVFGFGGQDTLYLLFVFVFLVALGIDYNIFLMTRVREEALVAGTRRGVVAGLAATGGVITSAGLVLAGTFAALGTLPAVSFVEIGFTVAFGVLLDTFLVRTALVPALASDIGRAIWWPSALARRTEKTPEPDAPAPDAAPVPVS
ncbi:MMPL family transporter [Dactylosporangium sp. NPDC049525]|uniref:MMPL family transporter n=1 Tax=Dactylosporangium sp. NPDC049525 TaxID=3154730 RepID=UPI0034379840